VAVTLRKGETPGAVRLAVAGKAAATRREGERLLITVPPFEREEVIRIERKA
jgi:hypothetical protein